MYGGWGGQLKGELSITGLGGFMIVMGGLVGGITIESPTVVTSGIEPSPEIVIFHILFSI
jgi:hypothetical protein